MPVLGSYPRTAWPQSPSRARRRVRDLGNCLVGRLRYSRMRKLSFGFGLRVSKSFVASFQKFVAGDWIYSETETSVRFSCPGTSTQNTRCRRNSLPTRAADCSGSGSTSASLSCAIEKKKRRARGSPAGLRSISRWRRESVAGRSSSTSSL